MEDGSAPPQDYCSTVTDYSSLPLASRITVSGTAYYGYRLSGNGEVADGGLKYKPTAAVSNGTTYTITLNGVAYSYTANNTDTELTVANNLVSTINADAAAPVVASVLRIKNSPYDYYTLLNEKNYGVSIASESRSNLTKTVHTAPNPIRYAEIMVKNSSGSIIQCGQTSNTGTYSLTLPAASSGTYTVYVNSRILDSTKARAYVLQDPTSNLQHSISTTVSATGSSSSNNLLAPGFGTLEGGAFNILDQIIKTNEYLKANTDTTHECGPGKIFSNCTPFTAAPIVYAYWKKGVNPYTYFGSSSPSSFYTGDSKLYILGGSNGDVDNSDCDHFDNSVIVHEYGHFLEDAYAVSESPGGYHNGNGVIDPRLAWSEGWADFIQAAVSGVGIYRDTRGNSSGTLASTLIFSLSVEDKSATDTPTTSAEGLFREFSITRLLWDAIDAANEGGVDNVNGTNGMAEIWNSFAGTSGLIASNHPFRYMGYILTTQASEGSSDWSMIRSSEEQNGSADYSGVGHREYATPIDTPATNAAACTGGTSVTIDPEFFADDDHSFETSNQLMNNDFFAYYHSGGTLTVRLNYSTDSTDPADLDLYVYNSTYTYGLTSTMLGSSTAGRCSSGSASCATQVETVSKSAPAGYYMINVMAYTYPNPGGNSTYTLTINGSTACPRP